MIPSQLVPTPRELDERYRGWGWRWCGPLIPKRYGGGFDFDNCLSLGWYRADKEWRILILLCGFGFRLTYAYGAPAQAHAMNEAFREFVLSPDFKERLAEWADPTQPPQQQRLH